MIHAPLVRTLPLALVLGLASSLQADALQAQARGSVVGIVLDDRNGRPVVGATVALVGSRLSAQANEAGEFMFPDVPAGILAVRIEHPGYGTIVEQIRIEPDGVADLQVALPPLAVVLRELLVQGRRSDTPQPGASITEVSPGRHSGFTAADLLAAHVPGLAMGVDRGLAGRGATINIRGVGSINQSDAPLIYLDGIQIADHVTPRTPNGVQALSVLAQIPAREVASIRVLRGPAAAALYPNAANGVIVIRTRSGSESPPD